MRYLIKIIVLVIGLPIIAFILFQFAAKDQGYVLITGTSPFIDKEFTIETRLIGFIFGSILFFAIGYAALRLFFKIIGLPSFLKRFTRKKLENAAGRYYTRAELALIENNPQLAEKLFLQIVKESPNPSLCYFGAARAAQMQGKYEERDKYLASMDFAPDKNNRLLAGILRGEFLNKIQEYEKARKVLEKLKKEEAKHYRVLHALAISYQKLDLFEDLYNIMPELHASLPKDERTVLEPELYVSIIDYVGHKYDENLLKSLWSHVPKDLKLIPSVVVNYAEKMLYAGNTDEAEHALRSALKKQWNDLVITAYGHLYKGDIKSYIRHAESFFKQHPESAYAAIAIARLNYQLKRFDESIEYLKKAIMIDHTIPEAHHLLAEILLEKGEFENAALSFREAGRLTYAKPSAELLQVEGELLPTSDQSTLKLDDKSVQEENENVVN